jgi:hypothetical protein
MSDLKMIWPTLGDGYQGFPRNLSWTKKGSGRRHNHLSKKHQSFKDMYGIDLRRMDAYATVNNPKLGEKTFKVE